MIKKNILSLIALLLIGTLFLTSCNPPTPSAHSPEEPFFFIQMSDPQFGHHTENKDFTRETELFQKAVAQANHLQPDFVVITGDLVNQPGNEAQAKELLRIAAQLDKNIPLYWVVGNHDVEYEPTEKTLTWYRQKFGPDWFSFDKGNWHFVVLNSTLMEHPENVPDQAKTQEKWLIDDLQKSRLAGKYAVLFMHYPLLPGDHPHANQHFRLPRPKRDYYLKLFRENNVRALFAGHLHYNLYAKDGDMEIVATGTVSGQALGDDPHGFRIIKVLPQQLEHHYYSLDNLPQKLE